MTQTEKDMAESKEAKKKLRLARKEKITAASATLKKQKKAIKAIKEILKDGSRTIPKLAEETGFPTSEALWYIMALKKYGEVVEGEKDGGYFQYELAGQTSELTEDISDS